MELSFFVFFPVIVKFDTVTKDNKVSLEINGYGIINITSGVSKWGLIPQSGDPDRSRAGRGFYS
jgi:hypothetical protein